jgi:predicted MPP superfamily phosphohydrolase
MEVAMVRTVVLRFRDITLVDTTLVDTIALHSELIRDAVYAWWGWWKKADELSRADECQQLQALLRKEPLEIGIFDRSTSRFFKAQAVDIVFELSGDSIHSPENSHTPQYYQSAKVAAWFKLTKLKQIAKDEFVGVFGDIPSGNGTFFPVPMEGGSPTTSRSLIGEEVDIDSPYILHLSDLHFGSDFGFPLKQGPADKPLLDMLATDISRLAKSSIGILIVSGDFTTKADANVLMTDSLEFLNKLAERVKIEPQQVILVPGNHDISLRDHEPYSYKHETVVKLFMKEFYGRDFDDFMQLYRFRIGNKKIEILSINSVRLRTPRDMNYGYVEWSIYDDFLRKRPAEPDCLRIAVLHHHLAPAPTEEQLDSDYPEAGVSVTLDAGAVTEGLQAHGFRLVLHGHQHVPGVMKISRGRLQDDSLEVAGLADSLFMIAGGTTGSKRYNPPFRDNSYGLIQLKEEEIRLTVRRFSSAAPPRTHFTATIGLGGCGAAVDAS